MSSIPPPTVRIDWPTLVSRAKAVRNHAHAPYSKYRVGAAILTANYRIFDGCNVENASYGLSLCAERNAIGQMVAAGERDPIAIAVVTAGPEAGTPCGMCRQVLAEFSRSLTVGIATPADEIPQGAFTIAELLPHGFSAKLLPSG